MGMERRMVWGYMGSGTKMQGKKCTIMDGRNQIK